MLMLQVDLQKHMKRFTTVSGARETLKAVCLGEGPEKGDAQRQEESSLTSLKTARAVFTTNCLSFGAQGLCLLYYGYPINVFILKS